VLHTHRVLHAAMQRAVRWRLVPVNPVDGVEPPHVSAKERDFLTADESEQLVAELIGQEYELPILVGLYCGLRPTEYLALRWRDVDLDAGGLRVTQNVHRIRQDEATEHAGQQVWGFRFGPAKTHRSKRPVSMPAIVVELLRAHRTLQAAARAQAGAVWVDLVFTDPRGYPHNHDRVRRAFYRALDAAGVRQVVLYALRHTMATLVLHETKDLKLVATRLGHSNEMLVLRTYGHLLPGVDREAADRLGEVVKRRANATSSSEVSSQQA
jgi:integrase